MQFYLVTSDKGETIMLAPLKMVGHFFRLQKPALDWCKQGECQLWRNREYWPWESVMVKPSGFIENAS